MISVTMEQVRRDQVAGDRLPQLIRTHFETSGEKKKKRKRKFTWGRQGAVASNCSTGKPNQCKAKTIHCNLLKQANLPRSGL